MVQKQIAKQRHHWKIAVCGLLIGTSVVQGCKDDDVLTGQPSWLGNSIYERLEEDGHYTTMLKLIDDLGQKETLSHTGSKTLFAANDSAFEQWYGRNSWGVNRYEQLSLSQKKLLLNNSMINNAYLIELLSNINGNPPIEGKCMRRETAVRATDSVQILRPSEMPNGLAWAKLKAAGKSIALMKDATEAPMIHLLPAFMKLNKITAEDLDLLTNHEARDANEAWINGKKVTERDITCKNGYIQKVDGIIEGSPNMAEIIRRHEKMKHWSALLDRFAAPYYDADATKDYNRLYGKEDSVYVLRYYSELSAEGENARTPDGENVEALLKFDPGWNQYALRRSDLNTDAGAMLVPTNEALEEWWNNEGKDLKREYGTIDSIPEATLAALINVNMLPSMVESVPSKFSRVLNDAMEELGIKKENVDSCFLGCNGVVYMTNKVFPPAEFSSVAYPALAHPSTMSIIYWAIDQLYFRPYLLSMDARYSVILPTNDAMRWYIDPASYGGEQNGQEAPTVLEFYYDEKRPIAQRVQARRWKCTVDENGNITLDTETQPTTVAAAVIRDNLKRLMDQLIIVGDVEDGHELYKSKGGTLIRVFKAPDGRLAFAGGWQIDHKNKPVVVNAEDIYTKANGVSYQVNDQIPLATEKSVYMTLKGRPEFKEFLELMDHDGAELLSLAIKTSTTSYAAGLSKQGNKNLRLLDNYNYTIYAPTNEAIKQLIDDGLLPTWEDYEAQTEEIWGTEEAAKKAQDIIKNTIVNFIRYHIQDHSIAINMAPEGGKYENSYESMKRNAESGRYEPLIVNNAGGQMWVEDIMGNRRHVVKADGLYNQICREYWLKGSENVATTYMASDAVVHQIDGVLLAEKMTPWREKLKEVKSE
jgi:uncharacterized surface protein with fasciclin (FAS1) repeats